MPSAAVGDSILFHRIMVFLAVYTLIMGVVNLTYSGEITAEDLVFASGASQVPGQYLPGEAGISGATSYFEGTNTALGPIYSSLDFTSMTEINPNVTTLIGGPWTLVGGTGLQLTGLPFFGAFPYLNPSVVVIRNARQSPSGKYEFTANVNNVPRESWYIYPRYISGYSASDLKVVMSSDGFHIKKFPLSYGLFDAGDDYYYGYPNANLLSSVSSSLSETVSSSPSNNPDVTSTLTISTNSAQIFSVNVRSILPGLNINDMVRHGGAGSDSETFIVQSFTGTSVLDNSSTIISGDSTTKSYTDSIWGGISGFFSLIAGALGITGSPILPAWFNTIVIGSCIATLSYLYMKMVRGN